MFKQSIWLLVLCGLVSCSEGSKPTHEADSTITEAPTHSEILEAAPEEPSDTATAQQSTEDTTGPQRPALDLRLPADETADTGPALDVKKRDGLPNLFEQSKTAEKKKILAVSGKVLTDPNNKDYVDSVEGAEIKVEISTGKKP